MTDLSIEIARPVEEHARQVMDWRNDPATLAASFHREPKVWERFWVEFTRDYFRDARLPPIFVLEEGKRVAFLRFRHAEPPAGVARECCDISINVDPARRGKGLGVESLKLAAGFLRDRKIEAVLAEIRVGNKTSILAFESAGYSLLDERIKEIPDTGEKCPVYRYLLKV